MIMYPGAKNSPENHKRGVCSDGAKSTLATTNQNQDPQHPNKPASYTLPEWPQPEGIFSGGTEFRPLIFLSKLREMYEMVVVDRDSGHLAMEHQAFAALLMRRTVTLDDGSVLFKMFEVAYPELTTPDELVIIRDGLKYLRIDCLQDRPDANSGL